MIEYLSYFQLNGTYEIGVDFLKSNAIIAKRYSTISDLIRLLEMVESNSQQLMTFDERIGTINQIRIDPIHHQVNLTVQLIN